MTDRATQIVNIYRALPELECKGLCQESCGPIAMSKAELEHITAKYGSAPMWDDTFTCKALVGGKCSIYEDRPLICRLWGTVGGMPCKWGCVPKGGRISDKKAHKLLRRMESL
jgi:hypothetical protein